MYIPVCVYISGCTLEWVSVGAACDTSPLIKGTKKGLIKLYSLMVSC